MNKLLVILLFVFSLLALCLSLALLSTYSFIPFISNIVEYLSLYLLLDVIFAAFIAFLCLCFALIMVISVLISNKAEDLLFLRGKGKLRVSKQTIESTAAYSFADVCGISFSKVSCKGGGGHPEHMRIFVKLSLNDSSELVGLTETVQDKIAMALESSLGISPKAINVRIVEFNPHSRPKSSLNGRIV